ncbi:hypothetical protein BN7_5103 [Wickerhamomyces ciferrii]|uniref:Uncharacterized protein n=1 Tax=Wickerhamomyces ciferrii (strain ATCC 14091 / BCRC 22168 / CBS 111 / JCM 3599 / NBRC 0793 / NRRL Y-1031 F-60-10) TaxID=1206466 RepID=K0KQY2_WICCF|nr:uncharacterized protein BN7_5103 [Wickerhamomyces ciferrii]CCH45521.1 hypothetical protein BN7_5103 [Wickerhamomyces ciferrii]
MAYSTESQEAEFHDLYSSDDYDATLVESSAVSNKMITRFESENYTPLQELYNNFDFEDEDEDEEYFPSDFEDNDDFLTDEELDVNNKVKEIKQQYLTSLTSTEKIIILLTFFGVAFGIVIGHLFS